MPVQDRVVRDGTLITAGGVTSGIDFGLAVVAELMGREEAETVQLTLEYAPAPPFGAGTPAEAPPAVLERARKRLCGSRAAREAIVAGSPDACGVPPQRIASRCARVVGAPDFWISPSIWSRWRRNSASRRPSSSRPRGTRIFIGSTKWPLMITS